MTTITKDFDTYQIKYASRKVQTSSGLSTLYAVITCQSGTNHVQVGTIWFLDTPLQDSSYTNNIITMCLDISRFNDIVTLLRYEKPFRMYFDDSKKEASIQSFSHEAVGEQEGVWLGEYSLDKEQTSYDDLLHALRLSLKGYQIE